MEGTKKERVEEIPGTRFEGIRMSVDISTPSGSLLTRTMYVDGKHRPFSLSLAFSLSLFLSLPHPRPRCAQNENKHEMTRGGVLSCPLCDSPCTSSSLGCGCGRGVLQCRWKMAFDAVLRPFKEWILVYPAYFFVRYVGRLHRIG